MPLDAGTLEPLREHAILARIRRQMCRRQWQAKQGQALLVGAQARVSQAVRRPVDAESYTRSLVAHVEAGLFEPQASFARAIFALLLLPEPSIGEQPVAAKPAEQNIVGRGIFWMRLETVALEP